MITGAIARISKFKIYKLILPDKDMNKLSGEKW